MRFDDGSLTFVPKPKDTTSYHIFLSHSQQDGGDQTAHIKKELEKHVATLEIFTDVAAGRKENGLDSKAASTIWSRKATSFCVS